MCLWSVYLHNLTDFIVEQVVSTLFTFSQKAEDIDAMVSSLSPSTSCVPEVKVSCRLRIYKLSSLQYMFCT
jgi:hypothetical protein